MASPTPLDAGRGNGRPGRRSVRGILTPSTTRLGSWAKGVTTLSYAAAAASILACKPAAIGGTDEHGRLRGRASSSAVCHVELNVASSSGGDTRSRERLHRGLGTPSVRPDPLLDHHGALAGEFGGQRRIDLRGHVDESGAALSSSAANCSLDRPPNDSAIPSACNRANVRRPSCTKRVGCVEATNPTRLRRLGVSHG